MAQSMITWDFIKAKLSPMKSREKSLPQLLFIQTLTSIYIPQIINKQLVFVVYKKKFFLLTNKSIADLKLWPPPSFIDLLLLFLF